MKKYLTYVGVALVVFGIAITACSDKSKAAYAAGCQKGINTVLADLGAEPNPPVIEKFCADSAEEAK